MYRDSIWIVGAGGSLGKKLQKLLKKDTSHKVVGTDMDVDITDMKAVERQAAIIRPTVIINCASISDAEYCETHRVEAFRVNALGARNIAAIARQHNAKVIHVSTDDVFSGESDRAKNEFDVPTPKTVYGQSKYAGENFVRELNSKHLIVRSSWVYGSVARDYFSIVAEHGKKNEPFPAPLDKFSTPTDVNVLADFLIKLIQSEEYGIYHASSEGMCSRNQFAVEILKLLGYDTTLAIGSFADPNGARKSTVLENLMMKMTGIYQMPDWKESLKTYAENYRKGMN